MREFCRDACLPGELVRDAGLLSWYDLDREFALQIVVECGEYSTGPALSQHSIQGKSELVLVKDAGYLE
jgi:hypothetical protein